VHTDAAFARATILRVRQEINRFERYQPLSVDSESCASIRPAAGEAVVELRALVEEPALGELSAVHSTFRLQPLWRFTRRISGRGAIPTDILARAHDVARALVIFARSKAHPQSGSDAIAWPYANSIAQLHHRSSRHAAQ